jgi:hypothetical protein
MTIPSWPGLDGAPALPYRASFQRKSIQLPFATEAVPTETDAPEVIWGTTSPEGAVIASVGDLYIQTSASTGVAVWQKYVGAETATGWFRSELGAFNVKAFGAVGDGVADDTIPVQNTITAAGLVSGLVWLPPGFTFLVNGQNPLNGPGLATLHVPSNVTVAGAGYSSVLKFGWSDTSGAGNKGSCYIRNERAFNNPGPSYVFDTNIKLLNFRILGASNGLPSGSPANGIADGIFFRFATDVEIANLTVTNVPGIAILHEGVSRVRIHDNQLNLCGRDAISGGPYDTAPSTDVVIADNEISSAGDDCIACNASVDSTKPGTTPPQHWVIVGNKCRGSADLSALNFSRGLLLNGISDVLVECNEFSDTAQQSVQCTKDTVTGFIPTRVQIIGNKMRRPGQVGALATGYGIGCNNAVDLTIANNQISDATRTGMFIGDNGGGGVVDGFDIVNNTVARCGGAVSNTEYGIWLAGSGAGGNSIRNGLVAQNRVYGSAVTGIYVRFVDQVDVFGNVCYNNHLTANAANGSLAAGICVEGAIVIRVHGNRCYDSQGTQTQRYGFSTRITAITYLSLKDNYFQGNLIDYFILNVVPTNLHIRLEEKQQTLAFNASLTPDPRLGEVIEVTLTGNVTTVNEPPALARYPGIRFTLVFIQDGTGGRTVGGWSANYKQAWSDTGNTLSKRSSITFERDRANAAWTQIGAQGPYV